MGYLLPGGALVQVGAGAEGGVLVQVQVKPHGHGVKHPRLQRVAEMQLGAAEAAAILEALLRSMDAGHVTIASGAGGQGVWPGLRSSVG